MRRTAAATLACSTLALVAGCGSSNKSGSASSPTATTASTPSGSIKPNTTPKFASPSPAAPLHSGLVQVAYRNIAIDPDTLRVKVGTTVKWTNFDSVEHNVTSVSGPQRFASKTFGEGAGFEVKLNKPGTIHYECTIHPTSMNGTIEVVR